MISTKDMFSRFQLFSQNNEVLIKRAGCIKEYATESVGLEMGYYSQSKTDLYVSGIKRGKLLKKIPKSFNGFIYYFNDDHLVGASRVVHNKEFEIIDLDYYEIYCFGYVYALQEKIIPMRCFVYEKKNNRVIAFKSSNSYHKNEKNKPPAIIIQERYTYFEDELCSIEVKKSLYDFASEEEHFYNQQMYDVYCEK